MEKSFEVVPEQQSIFSDRTIADYSRLVVVRHPTVSNKKRADKEYEAFQKLDHHFDVVSVETTPDILETTAIIEDAMGDNRDEAVVAPATGDGGSESSVRATLGNSALLWKWKAGHGDNIGRQSFQMSHRGNPGYILRHAKIARTKPVSCVVTDENGNLKYDFVALDLVGFGESGLAAQALNAVDHRDERQSLTLLEQAAADARVTAEAIKLGEPFSVKWGEKDPSGQVDDREENTYKELTYTNLGRIAWLGHVRNSHLSDAKMVEISHSSRTGIGSKLFFARLYTIGLTGVDIPDGESVDFDIVKPTVMQKGGDHFNVAEGDHVHIARTAEEVLVLSTRKRP